MDHMVITPCKTGVIVSYFETTAREPLLITRLFTLSDLANERDSILEAFKSTKPN